MGPPARPAVPAWVDQRFPNPIMPRGTDALRSPRPKRQAVWADRRPVWPDRPADIQPALMCGSSASSS
eukprot:12620527-Heterocapsa_arctica.AAC.1